MTHGIRTDIDEMKLSKIKVNPNNPRIIKDDRFEKLKKSIQEFPAMMELRPIVVDNTHTILGGNMRYRVLESLGMKEIPDNWVKYALHLTDEEKRRFIIEDNVPFGEWDYDALANEWDVGELQEWGVDLPVFNESKDLSDNIDDSFRIEVICENENIQEMLYNELINKGYECRLLTL